MDIFVYGTLMYLDVMRAVIGRVPNYVHAYLPEHARYRVIGAGFSSIKEEWGKHVNGFLLRGITEEELEDLDRYEGYPRLYIRKRVAVVVGDRLISCETYSLTDQTRISDEEWLPVLYRTREETIHAG